MGDQRSRRRRPGVWFLGALLVASTLVSLPSAPALGQASAPPTDRWSGRWDVEGQSTEDGPFERFGVLTLELVTDGSLILPACEDADRYYRGTYAYGGGGKFEGCESSRLDYELFFDYYNDNGSWGQGVMTFTGGSPATWEGYYSPPTENPAGAQAILRWRGSKLEGCKAPESSSSRSSVFAAQTEGQSCDAETVSFTFTQGGLPRRHSRGLEDVRTVGTGKITFTPNDDGGDDHAVSSYSGRVVRELEYIHDEDRMRFRIKPRNGSFVLFETVNGRALALVVNLETVESSDSRCSEKVAGKPRRATLGLRDSSDPGEPDVVGLEVEGCSHQSYKFTGKKRVKVAILHKTSG